MRPGCEHVVITDAGHLVVLEHPALVNANLLALIDRALVRPSGRQSTQTQGH